MAESSVTLKTTGMHCPSCSMLIELTLNDLDGVQEAHSDHTTGDTQVTYDPSRVTPDEMMDAIRKAGYGAEVA